MYVDRCLGPVVDNEVIVRVVVDVTIACKRLCVVTLR